MSIYKNTRRDHAKHTYGVYRQLRDIPVDDCNDWKIIMLFHASYHHILAALFPLGLQVEGTIYEYKDLTHMRMHHNPNSLTAYKYVDWLIDERLRAIHDDFSLLRDLSWSARYRTHSTNPATVQQCEDSYKRIEAFCITK
ncbi:MAG: hypothetical protein JNL32_00025 [Candidatus Kapabacteria bacterium]|nr:hypothetical protein [Candidatus Kapabacteria bacterium]